MKKCFFIGIDLGGKQKKTTGLFVLKENSQNKLEVFYKERIFGKEIFEKIKKILEVTAVVAVDAPLSAGRGKGKMRLFEKFLSQKLFRDNRVNPVPPALMVELCEFAKELRRDLKKNGFVLDINLIEAFPTFLKTIVDFPKFLQKIKSKKIAFSNEDEEMAFYCAILAYWHWKLKTRYLGYKDGFLFLPELSFWKKEWRDKFWQSWQKKDRLRFRYLITNLFEKNI